MRRADAPVFCLPREVEEEAATSVDAGAPARRLEEAETEVRGQPRKLERHERYALVSEDRSQWVS